MASQAHRAQIGRARFRVMVMDKLCNMTRPEPPTQRRFPANLQPVLAELRVDLASLLA